MHVQPSDALPKLMLARYYGGNLPRFLSVDPGFDVQLGSPQSWNLYAYVRNNPVNAVDPTGAYGRGAGFTDHQWDKFDRGQKQAADDAEASAEDLEGAAEELENLEEGEELSDESQATINNFEKATGEGGGNLAERMKSAAADFRESATALRDDGSQGYIANAYADDKSTTVATAHSDKTMSVNITHQDFRSPSKRRHALGHEALHHAGGARLRDKKLGNETVYRGTGLVRKLARQRPDLAIHNPDNLLWFARMR